MAYSQEQLEALERALATGERRVTFQDKTIEYRTIDELQTAIQAVRKGLLKQAEETGLWPGSPRQIRLTSSKGF